MFTQHTAESAPAASRRTLEATTAQFGYLPAAVGLLATSPELLNGFLQVNKLFEQTTLDPLAREVLIMTMATRNGCHLCVAMHTAKLTGMGADAEVIAALREGLPLPDERLEAIRVFTLAVLASAGAVGDDELRAFTAHGYTERNALEVVLGIGTYTLSTLANRMTRAPLDEPLKAFEWRAA
jgi:AhpD family alkylhydroperoxidase